MMIQKIVVSITLVTLMCVGLPSMSAAEWNVFILETMHVPVVEQHSEYLQGYLEDAAKKQNQKLRIQTFNADGDIMNARYRLQQVLDEDRPDLVVSVATLATQVASKMLKKTKVPHLFCVVADPVGGGIVPQEGPDKDHQISGLVYGLERQTSLDAALRIARSTPPKEVIRLGFVYSRYASAISDVKAYQKLVAEIPDVEILPISIPYRDGETGMQSMLKESAEMIAVFEKQVDYWWQARGPLAEDPRTHELFKQSEKPILFGNNLKSVEAGAIVSLSAQTAKTSKELAEMAIKVLQGTPANRFKIGYASNYDVAVNLDTAAKHNLKIPQDIIEKAGDNIIKTVK